MRRIHFVQRQIAESLHQAILFILCVVLSLVALVSLNGFSKSVHSSFLKDTRVLHAADIILHAHAPFSRPLLARIADWEQQKKIKTAQVYEFYSIVRTMKQKASLLADLKAVAPGYPFYGTVTLASGRSFHEVLTPDSVIVEQSLLDRLHLHIGDRLRIGSAIVAIRDVVLQEPDRPVNFFALGPRVFLSLHDLASLDLIGKGSRVNYTILASVANQIDLDKIAGDLKAAALKDQERVETFRTADSGVKRFFDNFLFFLNLIAIFTLLLAGIGIQSSLSAFLAEQERTIAIMKAVGAGSSFIINNYFSVVAVLGLFGTTLGLGVSFLLERILPDLFRGLLPANIELTLSWSAVMEGLVIGLVVVVLFTLLPLFRLKEVRPRSIFGKEPQHTKTSFAWLFSGAVAAFFLGMVLWKVREVRTGVYFVLGVGLLLLLSFLCAESMLRFLQKVRVKNLVLRQALKGLFRPRNATRPIVVTLIASLVVIFTIALVEENLDATFVRSYPPDSTNLFFVDIQREQKEPFARELGIPAIYYPVVRGTIVAVNNEPIDRDRERSKRGDNLAREFSLTYHETLLDDERIIQGRGLFRKNWSGPQVSVLDTVLKMRDLKIGDVITFRIQGIPVEAPSGPGPMRRSSRSSTSCSRTAC